MQEHLFEHKELADCQNFWHKPRDKQVRMENTKKVEAVGRFKLILTVQDN